MTQGINIECIDINDAAKKLCVDRSTIHRWRKKYPDFPQPMEFGPRTIRFKVDELIAWMEKHRVSYSQSQP